MSTGDVHPESAEALLHKARALPAGDDRAEEWLLRALQVQKQTLGEDHPEVGLTARELGECYLARRKPRRAVPHLTLAADFCGRVLGTQCAPYAAALVRLAQAHLCCREFDRAEPLYLRALAILRQAAGEELNASVCLNNLGMLYHIVGDDGRAEPLLHEVVDVRRRVLGELHPLYLRSLQDLTEFYRSRNDLAQAELWQGQADDIEKKIGRVP
jgi:tetratricopeptide (TPR) repeat protein